MQSTGQNRRIVGIVTEFNPFHKGHEYLLQEAHRHFGDDAVLVCVMSGDFVQRGEPAVFSKYARAEAACRCGADLVIELPPQDSLSSAEGFARGAVRLLLGLGIDALCFGSELPDVSALRRLAGLLCAEETQQAVKDYLKEHPACSYPQARERVTERLLGEEAALLSRPNCILGIEYVKALLEEKAEKRIEVVAVPRIGVEHDGNSAEGSPWKSASALREKLLNGEDISAWVPDAAAEVYRRELEAGRGPVSAGSLEQAALAVLRLLPENAFFHCVDGADGAGARLAAAVASAGSLHELMEAAKTRRYTLSRIRRMCWRLVLGMGEDSGRPGFARLLAAGPKGREILRGRGEDDLPVLTKPAAVKKMSLESEQNFAKTAKVHDIYVLGYRSEEARKGGEDWRKGPYV